MPLNIIPPTATTSEIVETIRNAEIDSFVRCEDEKQYVLVKIVLIKLKRTDLSVELLNAAGQVLKQARAMRKNAAPKLSVPSQKVNSQQEQQEQQAQAVKALEAAFKLCRRSKLAIIGFSDGLVALPKNIALTPESLSSTDAIDIDTWDVYEGFETEDELVQDNSMSNKPT